MISRERVARAFSHQETDRPPIDFGATVVTCLDGAAYRQLKDTLGIQLDDDVIIDHTMGTVAPCEELQRRFCSDFRRISMNYTAPRIVNDRFESGFGIEFRRAAPHEYFDVVRHPLADAEIEDLETMRLPDPDDPVLYQGIGKQAAYLYEGTPYALVADFGVPGFYETSQKLRGYENLACDLLLNEDFLEVLYGKLLDLQMRYFDNYLREVGRYISVICYADDLGMQDRLQMSPDTYRKLIKPWHTKIFSFIHQRTEAKILLHSCGSVSSIIPDLAEAGVDILNPVQLRATDMEPQSLKDRFGKDIIFWGGVDEQRLLPYGTPSEVREEARRVARILSRDGGYVFAPSHNFQSDTPPENIIAMYDAVKDGL